MNWFRFYHGTVYDAKWLEIADELRESTRVGVFGRGWRAAARLIGGASCDCATPSPGMIAHLWTALMEHASEQAERGSVARFSARRHAAFCQVDRGQVEAVLAAFERHGMIARDADGVRLAKWDERQRDLSTTRVQKHRARQLDEIANPSPPVCRREDAASLKRRETVETPEGQHRAQQLGIAHPDPPARRQADAARSTASPPNPLSNHLKTLCETDETVVKRCETVGNARESESEIDLEKVRRVDKNPVTVRALARPLGTRSTLHSAAGWQRSAGSRTCSPSRSARCRPSRSRRSSSRSSSRCRRAGPGKRSNGSTARSTTAAGGRRRRGAFPEHAPQRLSPMRRVSRTGRPPEVGPAPGGLGDWQTGGMTRHGGAISRRPDRTASRAARSLRWVCLRL
jgi:hypothetical protein